MNAKHRVTSHCDHELGICGISPEANEALPAKKPLEIYTFIDPLCAQCWSMEPILKKLKVEYGHYFRIRVLLAGKLNVWNACEAGKAKHTRPPVWVKGVSSSNMPYAGDIELGDFHPYKASLAIKAAELQGPKAGHRFLRKLRETLFLQKQNITNEDVLKTCAADAGLDVDAFIADFHSPSAAKALQCDVQTTNEMDVDTVPTFVFFNDNSEEAGIKISGQYPFSIYVQLLEDMLGFVPAKATPPTLEGLLQTYGFLATAEVAMVLDLSCEEAEKKLKTLMLQQKVEAVPYEYGTFWKWLT
ncbi:UPF0413 protein YjbH [Shouchella clausii]|uniref:ClpXP adapter SpxH family protein n=1 Tax=Shouchella tritolerans TaxID=2979466 RepID=UPI00078981A2|nr:ClpXP adapter SpxH family protein [Shouchella tritolerans]GIN11500.1 UPF0413 protein YjbH [Shouchella clausii]